MIYIYSFIVILIIAFLEYTALQKNIDNITLALSLFLIGLLTPFHNVILKFIQILKNRK
jgi:hypothetical protein